MMMRTSSRLVGSLALVLLLGVDTLASTVLLRHLQQEGDFVSHNLAFQHGMHINSKQTNVQKAKLSFENALLLSLRAMVEQQPMNIEKVGSNKLEDCSTTTQDMDTCIRYETTVHMWIDPDLDVKLVERLVIRHVRDFVDEFNPQEQHIQVIYEYPIMVTASILFTLQGVNRIMNDDEQFLFLKEFQQILEPIMLDGAYEHVESNIIVQHNGTKLDNDRRQLQNAELESNKNDFNKVDVFVRGACAGETCFDANFAKFLRREVGLFAVELLSKLKSIGPPTAITYFDEIRTIKVSESTPVEPLGPTTEVDLTEPQEETVPYWVWVCIGVVVVILSCAMGWTCYGLAVRKQKKNRSDGTNQNRKQVDKKENKSDEPKPLPVGYQERQDEEQSNNVSGQ